MKNLDLVGNYLFALPFGVFGLMHLMAGDGMSGLVPTFIPGGVLWVYLTGISLLAACIAILIGKQAKLAATLLGVLMLVFVASIHLPAVIGGDQMAMSGVLKDLALAGAAWMYAAKTDA